MYERRELPKPMMKTIRAHNNLNDVEVSRHQAKESVLKNTQLEQVLHGPKDAINEGVIKTEGDSLSGHRCGNDQYLWFSG